MLGIWPFVVEHVQGFHAAAPLVMVEMVTDSVKIESMLKKIMFEKDDILCVYGICPETSGFLHEESGKKYFLSRSSITKFQKKKITNRKKRIEENNLFKKIQKKTNEMSSIISSLQKRRSGPWILPKKIEEFTHQRRAEPVDTMKSCAAVVAKTGTQDAVCGPQKNCCRIERCGNAFDICLDGFQWGERTQFDDEMDSFFKDFVNF